MLEKLEEYELAVFADQKKEGLAKAAGGSVAAQFSLFAVTNESAIDELRRLDVDNLSAEESKQALARIQKKII